MADDLGNPEAIRRRRQSRDGSDDQTLPTPQSLSPASQNGDIPKSSCEQIEPFLSPHTVSDAAIKNAARGGAIEIVSSDAPVQQPIPVKLDPPPVLKLSQAQLFELTTSPESVPVRTEDEILAIDTGSSNEKSSAYQTPRGSRRSTVSQVRPNGSPPDTATLVSDAALRTRPTPNQRSTSSPVTSRRNTVSGQRTLNSGKETPLDHRPTLNINIADTEKATFPSPALSSGQMRKSSKVSPVQTEIPLPPLSLPTYLHLELTCDRPSPLFIHRAPQYDIPYESSAVKFERLLNFLLLPHQLERVLLFGTLACLDAWLYNFTILPLRFVKAVGLLGQWWVQNISRESRSLAGFVYRGLGRLMARRGITQLKLSPKLRQGPMREHSRRPSTAGLVSDQQARGTPRRSSSQPVSRHRRTRSQPSALLPNHKGDILHGLLIIISCWLLVRFDASRMYHNIRGQAAIKLYVIYNVLEVGDRLFSALGQDVLECLFSKETLERKPNGRSKVIRPFWMFILALVYNVIHATMLFYQVVTLNVAVNSYSNALLTLLMSNQFVEIRGTVFKKFEKENLFQMVCADVVERFQLWLMLLIIALRNIAEVGGLSIGGSLSSFGAPSSASPGANFTDAPLQAGSILPKAFTLIPKFTGQVLGPFLVVLGSEMLVDCLKHAYINKFNGVKPTLYARFLDVLAKDYYSHAFSDQNLTKRMGLPVLPLSCLFIRAAVQTYHMFLAAHVPPPIASSSTATSTAIESVARESSAATNAALAQIDIVIRRALGRSSFGGGAGAAAGPTSGLSWLWSLDDFIALTTMILFFLILYLFLLAFKLALGMMLLKFARSRYTGMQAREMAKHDVDSRRVGPWGAVEMNNDMKRYINADDTSIAPASSTFTSKKENEMQSRTGSNTGKTKKEVPLDGVGRYMMVAKRIW